MAIASVGRSSVVGRCVVVVRSEGESSSLGGVLAEFVSGCRLVRCSLR